MTSIVTSVPAIIKPCCQLLYNSKCPGIGIVRSNPGKAGIDNLYLATKCD